MLHTLVYWSLVGLVFFFALRALMPPRRRRPYRPYGRPTPFVRQDVTRLYGTTASGEEPGTAGSTRAASPSPRPPGTPGNTLYPPPPDSTTLTTHPYIFNGESHSTVWTASDAGDASSMLTYGDIEPIIRYMGYLTRGNAA